MIQNPNVIVRNLFEKEGLVFNGIASSNQTFTYEGDYQYLDIDYYPNSLGGSLTVRGSNDYTSNVPTLIDIYDRDEKVSYQSGNISLSESLRPLHLRIDARNVNGIRVILASGSDGKLCVSKVFVSQNNYNELKFTPIITSALSASKNFIYETKGQRYLILKVTMSEVISGGSFSIFNGPTSQTSTKDAKVFSNIFGIENSVNLNFTGTQYFIADIQGFDIARIYINSSIGTKISSLHILFTNNLEEAKSICGIDQNYKPASIWKNNVAVNLCRVKQLDSRRWYVMYVDFISGNIPSNYTSAFSLGFRGCKIYRYDGVSSTGNNFNFSAINELRSGFYFADLTTATNDTDYINLSTLDAANIANLNLTITHYGQYDNIEEFIKPSENIMKLEDNRFFFEYTGHDMNYALDDFWVKNGSTVTLGKGEFTVSLDLSTFNWGTDNAIIDLRGMSRLLHPQYSSASPDTTLMLHILNGDNNNAPEWWVCNITNDIRAILTKSNWTKVKFWEKRGTNRKIPTKNISLVDANHRYDTTLPDSYYNYDEVSTNGYHIAYQGEVELHMLRWFGEHGKKLTVFGQYTRDNDRTNLWVTSDGGYNFVSAYDFVGLTYNANDSIDTSHFADYVSGLTLHKVVRNIPTAAVKEPEHKYTITELSGWTITKGQETVINFTSPHGLTEFDGGDIVAFSGNSTDEWNQLRSSELTADSIGDNVYFIKVNSTTQITLKPFRGSYDQQIACRHIHSVNESKSGFVFATGEGYPLGWTMFLEVIQKQASATMDAMTENFKVYRLNSSENGLQRACGVLMYEDDDDPTILFNSDHEFADTGIQWSIEGRTNLPKSNSIGLWKGKLSGIDSYANFECILGCPEAAIWTIRYNGVIMCYYQSGGIAISVDDGKSFRYYPYYDGVRPLVGVYQGNIIVNNGYALKLK